MKKFWSALASYGRVVVATVGTVIVSSGHMPETSGDWGNVGKAALWALLPVILRWLNPNDAAYGIGSTPSGK